MNEAAAQQGREPADPDFMVRVFYVFAALVLISVAISLAGKWIGRAISAAGHSADATIHEIVIGNNVLSVPANFIRHESARASGEAHRLDLYMRWPEMDGYSNAARDIFNHRDGSRSVLFFAIEPRVMSRDMSGRLEPIYRRLIELPGALASGGLRAYDFSERAGYGEERLLIGDRPGEPPFVVRCLKGAAAADSLAGCERDLHFGDELSLTYRFHEQFLEDWAVLDKAVMRRAAEFLRIGEPGVTGSPEARKSAQQPGV